MTMTNQPMGGAGSLVLSIPKLWFYTLNKLLGLEKHDEPAMLSPKVFFFFGGGGGGGGVDRFGGKIYLI